MRFKMRENESEIDYVLIKKEHWWFLRYVKAICCDVKGVSTCVGDSR